MFEEIRNRITYLNDTKASIQELYLATEDEAEQMALSERNMQISMELKFLNKLLQYDVSGSCEWCKNEKENRNGLCKECGRFPSPNNYR